MPKKLFKTNDIIHIYRKVGTSNTFHNAGAKPFKA